MDDPLSEVDDKVGKQILKCAFVEFCLENLCNCLHTSFTSKMPLLIFAWKASLWDKEKATGSSPIEIKEQKDLQHRMKRRNMKVTCQYLQNPQHRKIRLESQSFRFSLIRLQHTLQVGSRQTKTSGTSYYKHLFVSCLVKYMHQY